jgi:hypothetical protein
VSKKHKIESMLSIEWPAIRKLYEATHSRDFSVREIARRNGVTEGAIRKKAKAQNWSRRDQRDEIRAGGADVDLCIATNSDWKRSEEGASKVPAIRSSEDRDDATRDTTKGVLAPSGSDAAPQAERERIRSPIRELEQRDKPSIVKRKSRKLSAGQLVDSGRDAAEALICQLRDAIGNRDTLMDMLEEWNMDHGDHPRRVEKYAAMHQALQLKELSLALRNAVNVVKSLYDQQEKVRAEERDKELADSPFARRRLPPPRFTAPNSGRQ